MLYCLHACSVKQATKPIAAKLFAGATNASYQANATRAAAQQALKKAQNKLAELRKALSEAQSKKQDTLAAMSDVPSQLGAAQFQVGCAAYCLPVGW